MDTRLRKASGTFVPKRISRGHNDRSEYEVSQNLISPEAPAIRRDY